MLDAFFALLGQTRKPHYDELFTADEAIVKAQFARTSGAKQLSVVCLPWHMPAWYVQWLLNQLSRSRQDVLLYHFNPHLLENSPAEVVSSYEFIALATADDVKTLRTQHHYQAVNLVGISLGVVALCISAEKIQHFKHVIMISAGSELAGSLWFSWRTHRIRHNLQRHGVRLGELQQEWDILAPSSHLQILRRHPVSIILARKDKFIPYALGRAFADDLQAIDPAVEVKTSPFGHIATILLADAA